MVFSPTKRRTWITSCDPMAVAIMRSLVTDAIAVFLNLITGIHWWHENGSMDVSLEVLRKNRWCHWRMQVLIHVIFLWGKIRVSGNPFLWTYDWIHPDCHPTWRVLSGHGFQECSHAFALLPTLLSGCAWSTSRGSGSLQRPAGRSAGIWGWSDFLGLWQSNMAMEAIIWSIL